MLANTIRTVCSSMFIRGTVSCPRFAWLPVGVGRRPADTGWFDVTLRCEDQLRAFGKEVKEVADLSRVCPVDPRRAGSEVVAVGDAAGNEGGEHLDVVEAGGVEGGRVTVDQDQVGRVADRRVKQPTG